MLLKTSHRQETKHQTIYMHKHILHESVKLKSEPPV